jgi:hypothetical protein
MKNHARRTELNGWLILATYPYAIRDDKMMDDKMILL